MTPPKPQPPFAHYAQQCLSLLKGLVAAPSNAVPSLWLSDVQTWKEKESGTLKEFLNAFFTGDSLSQMHQVVKALAVEQRISPEVIKLFQTIFAPAPNQRSESLHSFGPLYNDGGLRNDLFFHVLPSLMRWQCLGVNAVDEVASPALLSVIEQSWKYKVFNGSTYCGYGESIPYNMSQLLNGLLQAHLEYPNEFNDRSFKNVLNYIRGEMMTCDKSGMRGEADHIPGLIRSTLNIYDHLDESDLKKDFNPFKWLSFVLSNFKVNYSECEKWCEGESLEVWNELLSRQDLKKFNDGVWAWNICEAIPLKHFPPLKEIIEQADIDWWTAFLQGQYKSVLYSAKKARVEEASNYTFDKPYSDERLEMLEDNFKTLKVHLDSPQEQSQLPRLLGSTSLDEGYNLLCVLSLMLHQLKTPLLPKVGWSLLSALMEHTASMYDYVDSSERSTLGLKDKEMGPTCTAFWGCFKALMNTGGFDMNSPEREKDQDLVRYLVIHSRNAIPEFVDEEVVKIEGWQNSVDLLQLAQCHERGSLLLEKALKMKVKKTSEPALVRGLDRF